MKKKRIVFVTLFAISIAVNIAVITLLVLSYINYKNLSTELEAVKAEARDSSKELDALWGVFDYTVANYLDEDKLSLETPPGPQIAGPDGEEDVELEKKLYMKEEEKKKGEDPLPPASPQQQNE